MGRISTRKHKEKDMDETDILKERKERILAYMESEGYVPIKRRDMRAMLSGLNDIHTIRGTYL